MFSILRSSSFLTKCKATYSRMLALRLMSCELRMPAVKWWIRNACCHGHIPVGMETTAPLASLLIIPYPALLQHGSEASYDLQQLSFIRAVGFAMAQDNLSWTMTFSQLWACLTTTDSWGYLGGPVSQAGLPTGSLSGFITHNKALAALKAWLDAAAI